MTCCSNPGSGLHAADRCVGVLLQVVFRLLLDVGDAVLCEEYTYPHIAESLVTPQGFVAVPLSMDGHGIVPSLFRRTLEGMRAAGQKLPRLLYTVPVGQNPTGAPAAALLHAFLKPVPDLAMRSACLRAGLDSSLMHAIVSRCSVLVKSLQHAALMS